MGGDGGTDVDLRRIDQAEFDYVCLSDFSNISKHKTAFFTFIINYKIQI